MPTAPAGRTAFFKIQGISLFACAFAVGRQEVRACTAKENTESEVTFDTLPLTAQLVASCSPIPDRSVGFTQGTEQTRRTKH